MLKTKYQLIDGKLNTHRSDSPLVLEVDFDGTMDRLVKTQYKDLTEDTLIERSNGEILKGEAGDLLIIDDKGDLSLIKGSKKTDLRLNRRDKNK